MGRHKYKDRPLYKELKPDLLWILKHSDTRARIDKVKLHQLILEYNNTVDSNELKHKQNRLIRQIMVMVDALIVKFISQPYYIGRVGYLDDMMAECRLQCIKAINNRIYDPNKSPEAFSYLTQVCYNACKQCIIKEHKKITFEFEYTKELMPDNYQAQDYREDNKEFQIVPVDEIHKLDI